MARATYYETFTRAFPGMRIPGQPGLWYRCAICGRWCARPGYLFPEHMRMEVDHKIPFSRGGSNELYNLQATCKPCNRAKGNQCDMIDYQQSMMNAAMMGKQFKIAKRKRKRKSW